MLMGMRGAKHRFMPNRLVFPGGAVDRADLQRPVAHAAVDRRPNVLLRKNANERLAHGLGIAAARELQEETGLSLGSRHAWTCCTIWHARSRRRQVRSASTRGSSLSMRGMSSGELGGDGELENLRYYRHAGGAGARPRDADAACAGAAATVAGDDRPGACRTHARPGHVARSRVADGVTAGLCRFRLICKARYVAFRSRYMVVCTASIAVAQPERSALLTADSRRQRLRRSHG